MDTEQPQKTSFAVWVQRKLATMRFAAFSILLHAILLFIAFTIVVVKIISDPPDFAAEGSNLVGGEVETVAPPVEMPEDPTQSQQLETDAPQITAPVVQAITSTTVAQTNFKMASAPAPKVNTATDASKNLSEATRSVARGIGKGVPGVMGGRMGGSARTAAMQKNNMKEKTEKAVLAGLRWLKEHQAADGSWGEAQRPAMTGLAMLAFLGHGELPESPEFGPTVKKGIEWMIKTGTQYQGRFAPNGSLGGGPPVYSHGIATYALGEYYSMTKDDTVQDILKQAVQYILNGQNPGGGWDYGYAKGTRQDLSVAGWQIQALKAAHLTGLNINGVDQALDKAMVFLKSWQGDGGGFGYDKPGSRYGLTGVGVLCTIFWKGKDNEVCRDGISFLIDQAEGKEKVKYKEKTANLYAWYYNTQACLMFGGSAWTKWNRMFQDEIVDAQSPDGSWPVNGGNSHGPEKDAGGDGPYYRTAICVLMLESYYRYLPASK